MCSVFSRLEQFQVWISAVWKFKEKFGRFYFGARNLLRLDFKIRKQIKIQLIHHLYGGSTINESRLPELSFQLQPLVISFVCEIFDKIHTQ